jgi:hypothetical protein
MRRDGLARPPLGSILSHYPLCHGLCRTTSYPFDLRIAACGLHQLPAGSSDAVAHAQLVERPPCSLGEASQRYRRGADRTSGLHGAQRPIFQHMASDGGRHGLSTGVLFLMTMLIMAATSEVDLSGDMAEPVRSVDASDTIHPAYATNATAMLICVPRGRSPHTKRLGAQQTRADR